jgi:hypothetical protein
MEESLEKLIVTQLGKEFPACMVPDVPLPYSQEFATVAYLIRIIELIKICFNFMTASMV